MLNSHMQNVFITHAHVRCVHLQCAVFLYRRYFVTLSLSIVIVNVNVQHERNRIVLFGNAILFSENCNF